MFALRLMAEGSQPGYCPQAGLSGRHIQYIGTEVYIVSTCLLFNCLYLSGILYNSLRDHLVEGIVFAVWG